MGLYNIIFGKSANSKTLLAMLGLSEGDFYRFRDCYLDEKGRIAVYTRGGGGNRDCYCHDFGLAEERTVEFAGEKHRPECVLLLQSANRKHASFLFDEDDSFDSTYATFYFSIPENADREKLSVVHPELKRDDAWREFLTALEKQGVGSKPQETA